MDTRWLKGVPSDQREDRIKEIKRNKVVFEEIIEVLEGEFEKSTPDYSNPSWSHEMADQCGANRKLRNIISLLTIKE